LNRSGLKFILTRGAWKMDESGRPKSHAIAYIGIFLLIISVIVYLNLVFQQNLQKDIARQFNDQQLLLAQNASLAIENNVDNYVRHLLTIAQLPLIRNMENTKEREQVLHAVLFDMPKGEGIVVDFQLIDKHGIVNLDHARPSNAGMDVSDRGYYIKTRGLMTGEVHISGLSHLEEFNPNKRYITVSTPLISHGRFKGVALFAISVDDIAGEYVSQLRVGKRGYAWVVDSGGTLVYHPTNPEMIGKNLFEADASCFKCHQSFDAEIAILKGTADEHGVYTAPMGEDKLISFSRARFGKESWIVCVTVPFSDVTALISQSMRLYSWLISIIFFTVIATSVYFVILIKKKTAADERAKYAAELEVKVKERTAELMREKEKLNAILGGLGAGMALLDHNYNVEWVNEVISDNVPDAVGNKCYVAYMGRSEPCEDCPMPQALETGDIAHCEMRCQRAARRREAQETGRGMGKSHILYNMTKGDTGFFQVAIAPIKSPDGHIEFVVELIQDVTEMRRLKQQMMHSEKLAALGRISAGIAHEIGNPLTSIYSFLQILQSKEYDEFTEEALDTMAEHITRIKDIVQQMSGYSSDRHAERNVINLNSVVNSALELIGHEKGMKRVEKDVVFYGGPLKVQGDANWLVSVFVNLLLNALDAMPKGGKLSVRTELEEYPDGTRYAVAEVADTGTGIGPEDIERIFDPFFTTKAPGKGTGLGLSVSYNIIRDHGGDIGVTSAPGEGTTFKVRLPLEG